MIHKAQPAPDKDLFSFAQRKGWENNLDPHILERTRSITTAYREALSRLRYNRHIPKERKRQSDIERILFARGLENRFSVDELYHAFDNMLAQDFHQARIMLSEKNWHLTPPSERLTTTYTIIRGAIDLQYRELFCDFRYGGYRILGDIICDLDDMYRAQGISKSLIRKDDSEDLKSLLNGIKGKDDYKQQVIKNCQKLLKPNIKGKESYDWNEVLKCAVALGERQFALEVMPMTVLENCRRISHDK